MCERGNIKMKKVLILGVASVQMDALVMLKKMGIETYACAMAKDGPGADVADHFEEINILDESKLAQYIEDNDIDVVYSTGSDLAMPVVERLSEKLGLPHFGTPEVAYICNHKDRMRMTLTNECKCNVPFQVMEKPEKINISFPCIMKPSDSQGQRGVKLIYSQEEMEEAFENTKKFSREGKVIIEKYVDGPELSVNGYMVNGKLRFLVASDRITWPQFTGLIHKHVVPAETISDQVQTVLEESVEDACRRIGILNGPFYLQIKVENDKPYIIEITPRLDGCHMWKLLTKYTNVNLMKLTFEHLLDNNISELDKDIEFYSPHELVFFCKEPGKVMDQSEFLIPDESEDSFFYYNTGETIRPVNGKYEKVGYYIIKK